MKSKSNNLVIPFLYLSTFLIPFYIFRFDVFGIPTNVFEASVFVTFVIYLISIYRNKTVIRFTALDWFAFAFVLFSFIAVIFSPEKVQALGIVKGWFITPVIFYFMLSRTFTRDDASKISVPLFFALIFVTIWSFLQKYGIIGAVFYQAHDSTFNQFLFNNVRIFGPFESPNFLAMFIVPILILCLPLIGKMKDMLTKIVMTLLLIAPVIILLATKSRGGLFALLISLAVLTLIIFFQKLKLKKSRIILFAVAAVLAIGIFAAYKVGFDPNRDYARLDIYRYSYEMIKTDGLFGIGFLNFHNKIDILSAGNERFRDNILSYAIHPHNVFLAVWLYLGVGGLIAFLLILWQSIKSLFRNIDHPYSSYVFAAMIAILAHGIFDTTYFKNDLSAIFWLIVALSLIVNSNEKANR